MILQFIVLSVAWSILGGYAGYVNFGTSAFFGVGVYTGVLLFKAAGRAAVGADRRRGRWSAALLGFAVGLLTLRMQGIFFSIATIALTIVIETTVTNWRFLGGAAGIQIQRPPVTAPFPQLCADAGVRSGDVARGSGGRDRALSSRIPGSAAAFRRSGTTNSPPNAPACRRCG